MSRAVLQPFEEYQKARITFVQKIAELASRPQNIESLHSAGVMALLRPLLLDSVPSIQQSAALAIGRLANYSEELAESVVQIFQKSRMLCIQISCKTFSRFGR